MHGATLQTLIKTPCLCHFTSYLSYQKLVGYFVNKKHASTRTVPRLRHLKYMYFLLQMLFSPTAKHNGDLTYFSNILRNLPMINLCCYFLISLLVFLKSKKGRMIIVSLSTLTIFLILSLTLKLIVLQVD